MTKPKRNDGVKRFMATYGQSPWDTETRTCVLATEHDRKVAELEAKIFDLKSVEQALREQTAKNDEYTEWKLSKAESELATARKVIEKLKRQRNYYCDLARMHDKSYQEHVEDCDAEIEAIERGES